MSGLKHTPGPWRVKAKGSDGLLCVVPENNLSVADCCDLQDAMLCAAAPDLLEALRTALDASLYSRDDKSWEDQAIAAIEKATGQKVAL